MPILELNLEHPVLGETFWEKTSPFDSFSLQFLG